MNTYAKYDPREVPKYATQVNIVQNYVLIASFRVTSYLDLIIWDIYIYILLFIVVIYNHYSCEYTNALKPNIASITILREY